MRNKFIVLFSLLLLLCELEPRCTVYAEECVDVQIEASIPYPIIEKGTSVNIKTDATANGKKLSEFIYTSDNKSIATVDKNGKVTAKALGETSITVSPKKYPDHKRWIGIEVTEKIIKISGVKECMAGKTYQLKANEKNVYWRCSNLLGENAQASIDSKTGKLKIRNAGTIYVSCTSKDGKAKGAVYIYATGPMIEKQDISLDEIIIKDDEHLINITELIASGKLPDKITVSCSYNKKKENVDLIIHWLNYGDQYNVADTYTIYGYLEAPEGYFLPNESVEFIDSNVKVDIEFQTAQTDTRKKIISIEAQEPLTINKDMNIMNIWDLRDNYEFTLKCTLEDGSVVELPANSFSYEEGYIYNVGSYEFELSPGSITGYDEGGYDGPSSLLIVKVNKKQTYQEKATTLDDIASESWVYESTSQKPIK